MTVADLKVSNVRCHSVQITGIKQLSITLSKELYVKVTVCCQKCQYHMITKNLKRQNSLTAEYKVTYMKGKWHVQMSNANTTWHAINLTKISGSDDLCENDRCQSVNVTFILQTNLIITTPAHPHSAYTQIKNVTIIIKHYNYLKGNCTLDNNKQNKLNFIKLNMISVSDLFFFYFFFFKKKLLIYLLI